MLYQICITKRNGKSTAVVATATTAAATLADAYTAAAATPHNWTVTANGNILAATLAATFTADNAAAVRVYPYATADNAAAVMELAAYALRSFEKWERRNNFAVMNPVNRTEEERQDFKQSAALAILETLNANAAATMFDCSTAAFDAIAAIQKAYERKAEREYNPDWITCNITPKKAKATFPELDRLVKKAIAAADLTDNQTAVLYAVYGGNTAADYAAANGISKQSAYKAVNAAYCKIVAAMVELDKGELAAAGFTAAELAEKLAELKRKGNKR